MAVVSSRIAKPSRAAEDYYPSVLHEEALARLAYLAEKGTACGLLLGPAGCGKSLVLSLFSQKQRQSGAAVAAVSALGVSASEVLMAIGAAWGADVRTADDQPQQWKKTTDRLRVLSLDQVPVVLLMDDLNQAQDEVAVMLDRLQALAETNGANLVLIAAADDRCQGMLSPRLLSRVELRVELDVWSPAESCGFLEQWLQRQGGDDQRFDNQAMEVLHDLAEGIPRRIRQLAELTLLAGTRTADGNLSEEVVGAAYDELNIGR